MIKDYKCDKCEEMFTVFDVKIFSDEEGCSPFMELTILCHQCYEKHIKATTL
tara:strand:+ start:265 stop:420 length:156 start_codon:yes stop_codon:yes gene_type:complete